MIITKIEAKEACDWLKAAGFPQYAQLFKDCQFPIDIDWVKSDHEFLDKDAIDSLCRRLNTLNKCVDIKLEMRRPRRRSEDSEEEEPCAISTKWSFERRNRLWSRLEHLEFLPGPDSAGQKELEGDAAKRHSSCSSDSDGHGPNRLPNELETSRSSSWGSSLHKPASLDSSFSGPPSPGEMPSFSSEECFASEKPSRKRGQSLLRRMERLRTGSSTLRTSSCCKARPAIGGPTLLEGLNEERLCRLRCVDVSELQDKPESQASSSAASGSSSCLESSSSGSPSENNSAVSTPSPITRVRGNRQRARVQEQKHENEKNLHQGLVFHVPHEHKPGTFPTALTHSVNPNSVNWRTGSFHGYRARLCRSSSSGEQVCSPLAALDHRVSIYDNVPTHAPDEEGPEEGRTGDVEDDVFSALDNVMERINGLQQLVSTWAEKLSDEGDLDSANDSASPCPSSPKDIHLEVKKPEAEDPVASERSTENFDKETDDLESAYSNYSGGQSTVHHKRCLHWSSEQSLHQESLGVGLEALSADDMNLLQKFSLLKLTSLMDRYSPTSKQGWNWMVPKGMRKSKGIEQKELRVFGVPLLVSMQREGSPLPRSILKAIQYLRTQCLDQVGLFRKSGVKSRIQFLRDTVETDPEGVSYEGQSAFDVADMIKQFFRDLPESIFSSKLCETFLHIYQYFPKDQQFIATQAAIFLLPDENREALQTLLLFLRDVVDCVEENQMTPTNIAVCLAPSLFHLNTLRRDSTTTSKHSHRKYSLGRPDQRDLSENLAATQGLAHMVSECPRLFQVPEHWMKRSQRRQHEEAMQPDHGMENKLEDSVRLQLSTQSVLRENQERFRDWVPSSASHHVDLAFKKVEDQYPLRLWKATVEVEAPQDEVLHRVRMERRLWDRDLLRERVLEVLDAESEVYQYTLQALGSRLPEEHLLLRTCQHDPTTGAFVLAAVSTNHPEVPAEGMQVQVLTSVYLVESLGPRRTRLTHVCRTDTRGRTPEWYNKVWGHCLTSELVAIRDSFKRDVGNTKT
ncbi:rho GTPase-activating protein 7 isoform X1 [Scleropages formosus]|uniref:Si:dkeyp-23e4.3 n=1 Tax=Scleropages formosus TaxID=113540 RepID=A0A8C9RMJ7_SCLFO|nr:rho GTPase-activating protein 7-like isoform X1 [Scleropages formosus]